MFLVSLLLFSPGLVLRCIDPRILDPAWILSDTWPGSQVHISQDPGTVVYMCIGGVSHAYNMYGTILYRRIIIIIIKGHSLRRACLQPATNTQNSKPRPPTTNAEEN